MALERYEHVGAAPLQTLASGINNSDMAFTLNDGTSYPTGAVGPFVIQIDNEKVLCSSRAGAVFTVTTRGYDDTTATSHTTTTNAVSHVFAAAEADDDNDHIYNTMRDDHTQYARVDGTRDFSGLQTFDAGIAVTGAATVSTTLGVTGVATASALAATLAGSGRYVGSTNGAPGSGTFVTGDFATDYTTGMIWVCTSGGTPGTWKATSPASLYRAKAYQTSNQSIRGDAVAVVITYNTTEYDPASSFNTGTGTYTCPVAGLYMVTGSVWFANATATTTVAHLSLGKNGTEYATGPEINFNNDGGLGINLVVPVLCSAADTLTMSALQNSLTNVNTQGSQARTWMAVTFMGS